MNSSNYNFRPPQPLPQHIVQSPDWGEFKSKRGTTSIRTGNVQFTLHKIPLLHSNIGYCPKIKPTYLALEELRNAGKKYKCAAIRLDCPNVVKRFRKYKEDWKTATESKKEEQLLKEQCKKAPRNTFAKQSIILDLTPQKKELLMQMKSKTRYNVRYAKRKGIFVKNESNKEGLEKFLKLQRDTARRQGFLIHPDSYYREVWHTLAPKNKAHILIAYYEKDPTPLTALMLFNHKKVLYYPYGGSSSKHRDKQHSSRTMWESMLLGKSLGCELYDMWGATDDKSDDWWGFTRFKLGFGGTLVEFIDSYDLILNPAIYHTFNLAYDAFWKAVNLKNSLLT